MSPPSENHVTRMATLPSIMILASVATSICREWSATLLCAARCTWIRRKSSLSWRKRSLLKAPQQHQLESKWSNDLLMNIKSPVMFFDLHRIWVMLEYIHDAISFHKPCVQVIHAHTRNQLHSPLKKLSFVGTSCSKDVFSTAAANPAAKKKTVGGGGAHHSLNAVCSRDSSYIKSYS